MSKPFFIVALRAKNGDYCLFVEAFFRRNGKQYLKHTTEIAEAKHFDLPIAQAVADEVKEYRVHPRIERLDEPNHRHTPVAFSTS